MLPEDELKSVLPDWEKYKRLDNLDDT
jgi:hypothetical protein